MLAFRSVVLATIVLPMIAVSVTLAMTAYQLYQQHRRYSEEILGYKTKKMLAGLIMVLTMNSAVITARTTPNRNSSNSLMTVLTVTTIVIMM